MKIKLYVIPFTVLCISVLTSYAQPSCTTLGQTPSTAFPVCGTATFIQSSVPICGNTLIPGPCALDLLTDKNPFWYRFTCYAPGTLGFRIVPNTLSDDYDWQLFDITGHNANDVYADATLFVACNWSGLTGVTGASSGGTSLVNCGGNAYPIFSSMPVLVVGHEYLLLVSHWTDSQSGYQLVFGGGTAGITDPVSPKLQDASVDCGGQSINVHLNKKMKCSSLSADRSDFVLSPANGTIAVNTGFGCLNNFDMDSINISFTAPLPPGNYTLSMADGTDGNTLLDNCGTPVPVGNSISFTVPPRPALPGPNNVTINPPSDCVPVSIVVYFPEAVQCATAALDGSDFIVTGPSPVTVDGIIPVCTGGLTNGFTLHFSAPVTVPGIYTVQVASGTDGNTILGLCNRAVNAGDATTFTVAPLGTIAMGNVTINQCSASSLTLTFADPIQCNSIAANGSDFSITGPSAVTITSATPGTCNNGETNIVTLQFASLILTPGAYQVQAVAGSDGNTLLGQCKLVPVGNSSPFTINAQAPLAMGTVVQPACVPQGITLNFTDPINCNSIAANGSDFVVTGTSAVSVISATPVNCNANGETTSITIQFAQPVLTTGNFTVQVATGSDGNSLIGQCNRQVPAGVSAFFTLAPQPALPLGSITSTSCSPSSVDIDFPEAFDCFTISGDGSEFIVTGPSAVTVTAASGQCNVNPNSRIITVRFSAPITVSGTYRLEVKNGSDGNTIRGNCNRYLTIGDFTTFTVPPASPVPMDSIAPVTCSPSSLKLVFASPIRCSSISSNGSDFVVNGPSPVSITGATGTCDANGLTQTIDIQLASPITTGGSYFVQLVNGSDGNTLLSDCNRPTPAGASVGFIAGDAVSAVFQYQVQYDCLDNDMITFSHDGLNNVNQWTWTLNGAAVSSSQTFTQTVPAVSQNHVQLTVTNGFCSDSHTADIVLDDKIAADFKIPDLVCPEDSVTFINTSKGTIDTWQWTFGNGNTSAMKDPLSQIYPLTGSETLYPVSLTVGTNSGCQVSATKTLKVLSTCIIAVPSAFTPNNDGINDYLYPLNALRAENLDFKVFNRWGQLIFHSKEWTKKWDGTINGVRQATGVYVWMLDFTDKTTRQKYSMRGTTTLIR